LRLAVVSPFVDRRHGTERALAELIERLAHTYHCEVHLFSQHAEDVKLAPSGNSGQPENGAIYLHPVPRVPGPLLIQFLGWFYLNRLWRWYFILSSHLSFDLVLSPGINCADADVIIVHALFQRLRELSLSGESSAEAQSGYFRTLHRRMYYAVLARLERRIYSSPWVSLAGVSRRTADQLAQYFGRQDVRVVHNGVDTSLFSPTARAARRMEARQRRVLQGDEFTLLLIGNDWNVKGLATILEAMAALPDKPLRLLVAGGDGSSAFEDLAKTLQIAERCIWEGPTNDVLDLYACADVYVSPSREDSFGLPVAEAMACGLPVITSVFAGVSELIEDGVDGFVLQDPHDVQTLSRLFELLVSEPDLRRRIAEAAAVTAAAWTWDRSAAAVWQLLQDSVARD
jgi:glycosyltransferase involved in cell wall biosynthesis